MTLERSLTDAAGWTREFSEHHEELLSRSGGGVARVRRDSTRDV